MIDVRTLLFANAVVFTILAIAMLLVWRGNRAFPGLATLARVHAAMIPGTALIGLPPGVVPAALSAVLGNALVVLSVMWLLEGVRELYSLERGRWPRMVLLVWGAGLLFFLYGQDSLRGRILVTSCAALAYLLGAARSALHGLSRLEERAPSLLISGSAALLAAVFAVRCVGLATAPRVVQALGSDALTVALASASLIAGTGWTFGVMNLVYARLNMQLSRDLTARQQYETSLEQLVQVAAHELRSPLTSIFGALQLLSAPGTSLSDEDGGKLLSIARRNSERMVRLIDDLLDLERVESGQADFRIEEVDLERLLAQAKELGEGQARRLGVKVELAPLPQARLRADPQRLQQVLTNLISNAVKLSPAGQTVRLRASCAHGKVRIEVNDRGPGIPTELRPRIFQRFARGPVARPSEEQARGSGLGLAISKALVEGMGGKIGFETGEQTGTTFYFELPAEGGPEHASLPLPEPAVSGGAPR